MLTFALPAIEKILNHYLKLDPETKSRLVILDKKVILLQLEPIALQIYWLFTPDSIFLVNKYEGPVDVTLKGSLLDFLRFGVNMNDQHAVFAGNISTTGNLDTAQDFKELFANLEIDWEEQLSHVTGDVVAHQIGNVFRSIKNWAQQSSNTLQRDITEYVQEEARWLPPREELQHFFISVDKLRDDVERLELRVERLKTIYNEF